jgi:hypothetical protein
LLVFNVVCAAAFGRERVCEHGTGQRLGAAVGLANGLGKRYSQRDVSEPLRKGTPGASSAKAVNFNLAGQVLGAPNFF